MPHPTISTAERLLGIEPALTFSSSGFNFEQIVSFKPSRWINSASPSPPKSNSGSIVARGEGGISWFLLEAISRDAVPLVGLMCGREWILVFTVQLL